MESQISSLGYCVFEVTDLNAWREFSQNLIGTQTGRIVEGESLAIRLDEHESRILLQQGPSDDLVAAGWEFDTEDGLESYVARVKDLGINVEPGSRELVASRQVESLYQCADPNGWTHEFYFGPAIAPSTRAFHSPLVKGGFEAGRLGFGHFLPFAKNAEESNAFYKDVLGLTISDYIRAEISPGGPTLDATFYHVANGRHHSLATAESPNAPQKIGHIMVQAKDFYDVGLAYDRFVDAGVRIASSLGYHPNDHMTSFYVETPSGFGLEFGAGGRVIDDDNWEVASYSQMSEWGHRPVPRQSP